MNPESAGVCFFGHWSVILSFEYPPLKTQSQSVRPRPQDVRHNPSWYITKILFTTTPSSALSENQWSNIRYVQAYGNYLKVFCKGQMLMVRKTISEMEQTAKGSLIRVHKSYLISIPYMSQFAGNEITMDQGEILPIGKVYRKAFEAALN